MRADLGSPYLRKALAFPRDTANHTYAIAETRLLLHGRPRSVAVEVFTPRDPDPKKIPLALIPGGALTPAANFYDLAPLLMLQDPRRRFLFVNTPGTGLSSGKVWDLAQIDFARLQLAGFRYVVGGEPVILGGHSQGGGFAQVIARLDNELDPHERLKLCGLLLLDPVPQSGAAYIFWRFLKTLGSQSRIVREIVASPDASEDFIAFFAWTLKQKKSLSLRAFFANTLACGFPDAEHPVTVPALILGAEISGTVKQERLRAMDHSRAYP